MNIVFNLVSARAGKQSITYWASQGFPYEHWSLGLQCLSKASVNDWWIKVETSPTYGIQEVGLVGAQKLILWRELVTEGLALLLLLCVRFTTSSSACPLSAFTSSQTKMALQSCTANNPNYKPKEPAFFFSDISVKFMKSRMLISLSQTISSTWILSLWL